MIPPESDVPDPDPFALLRDDRTNCEKLLSEFGLSRGDARFEPSWSRAPTNGENVAAELFLRRAANCELWLSEAKAVIDPKTYEALVTLVAVSVPDHMIDRGGYDVCMLASGLGPGTMPAAHLADIVLAVRHADAVKAATSIHGDLAFQISDWGARGRKVTFSELAKNAECFERYGMWTHDALMRLAVKVGNNDADVGIDTKIDLHALGAATGPETMSLLTLVVLLTGIPGFDIYSPYLENLFSGDNPFWNIRNIPGDGICFGLARKGVGE
jgi:hypothetical protein